jgi:hypothetical protein
MPNRSADEGTQTIICFRPPHQDHHPQQELFQKPGLRDSNVLHCMLAPKMFNLPFVLRDSLSFVRMLDKLNVPSDDSLRSAAYTVTAFNPSIDLERGLQSLKWFMETKGRTEILYFDPSTLRPDTLLHLLS